MFGHVGCIDKIYSVSAVIGSGACNGNCDFCAGKYLREQAKNCDKVLYWKNYATAIKLCARYGGWSLSLTSSGEPTCDPHEVTRALEIYQECAAQGAYFPNVNLFTNGILLQNTSFCNTWLPTWRKLGLTNVAVSIHSVQPAMQMQAYGLDDSFDFVGVHDNIEKHGLGARATLLLRKGEVDKAREYGSALDYLRDYGFTNITSWPVGNPDGSRNEFTPSRMNLFSIKRWLHKNAVLCHGHDWGGGVYDYHGSIVRLTDYVTKHDPAKDYVRQLVVFQDGVVAYSWIREGALCMR